MPPKAKYTREDIINKAFEMARKNGIESVVARELGDTVGVCIEIMQKDYGLSREEAEMLSVEFKATLTLIKSGSFYTTPIMEAKDKK